MSSLTSNVVYETQIRENGRKVGTFKITGTPEEQAAIVEQLKTSIQEARAGKIPLDIKTVDGVTIVETKGSLSDHSKSNGKGRLQVIERIGQDLQSEAQAKLAASARVVEAAVKTPAAEDPLLSKGWKEVIRSESDYGPAAKVMRLEVPEGGAITADQMVADLKTKGIEAKTRIRIEADRVKVGGSQADAIVEYVEIQPKSMGDFNKMRSSALGVEPPKVPLSEKLAARLMKTAQSLEDKQYSPVESVKDAKDLFRQNRAQARLAARLVETAAAEAGIDDPKLKGLAGKVQAKMINEEIAFMNEQRAALEGKTGPEAVKDLAQLNELEADLNKRITRTQNLMEKTPEMERFMERTTPKNEAPAIEKPVIAEAPKPAIELTPEQKGMLADLQKAHGDMVEASKGPKPAPGVEDTARVNTAEKYNELKAKLEKTGLKVSENPQEITISKQVEGKTVGAKASDLLPKEQPAVAEVAKVVETPKVAASPKEVPSDMFSRDTGTSRTVSRTVVEMRANANGDVTAKFGIVDSTPEIQQAQYKRLRVDLKEKGIEVAKVSRTAEGHVVVETKPLDPKMQRAAQAAMGDHQDAHFDSLKDRMAARKAAAAKAVGEVKAVPEAPKLSVGELEDQIKIKQMELERAAKAGDIKTGDVKQAMLEDLNKQLAEAKARQAAVPPEQISLEQTERLGGQIKTVKERLGALQEKVASNQAEYTPEVAKQMENLRADLKGMEQRYEKGMAQNKPAAPVVETPAPKPPFELTENAKGGATGEFRVPAGPDSAKQIAAIKEGLAKQGFDKNTTVMMEGDTTVVRTNIRNGSPQAVIDRLSKVGNDFKASVAEPVPTPPIKAGVVEQPKAVVEQPKAVVETPKVAEPGKLISSTTETPGAPKSLGSRISETVSNAHEAAKVQQGIDRAPGNTTRAAGVDWGQAHARVGGAMGAALGVYQVATGDAVEKTVGAVNVAAGATLVANNIGKAAPAFLSKTLGTSGANINRAAGGALLVAGGVSIIYEASKEKGTNESDRLAYQAARAGAGASGMAAGMYAGHLAGKLPGLYGLIGAPVAGIVVGAGTHMLANKAIDAHKDAKIADRVEANKPELQAAIKTMTDGRSNTEVAEKDIYPNGGKGSLALADFADKNGNFGQAELATLREKITAAKKIAEITGNDSYNQLAASMQVLNKAATERLVQTGAGGINTREIASNTVVPSTAAIGGSLVSSSQGRAAQGGTALAASRDGGPAQISNGMQQSGDVARQNVGGQAQPAGGVYMG